MKLGRETMPPRRRHRLPWMVGALLFGAASGAALGMLPIPVPVTLCTGETVKVTVARSGAFEPWLDGSVAIRPGDTIRRVHRLYAGGIVIDLVRDGCPVRLLVTIF